MTENEIAQQIVDAAFKIHSTRGPGLPESVYQAILINELQKCGLLVEAENQFHHPQMPAFGRILSALCGFA